jgi:hypothetical protein
LRRQHLEVPIKRDTVAVDHLALTTARWVGVLVSKRSGRSASAASVTMRAKLIFRLLNIAEAAS